MFEIRWGTKREMRRYERGIHEYYKEMVNTWNEMIKSGIEIPCDRRKKEYKAMVKMVESITYMHDVIEQTEQEYRRQNRELIYQLSKWTSQQKGRKTKITEIQREEIKQARANGESYRSIARKHKVSERTIRRITTP
jgi:Mor family transcriptional regulator